VFKFIKFYHVFIQVEVKQHLVLYASVVSPIAGRFIWSWNNAEI
jgi:hypothetical protein